MDRRDFIMSVAAVLAASALVHSGTAIAFDTSSGIEDPEWAKAVGALDTAGFTEDL
jgi:hypothetical protein